MKRKPPQKEKQMTTLIQERVEKLAKLTLLNGSHSSVEEGMCAMEAVAWIAGEKHSDHPACACPIITAFMISWNDSIKNDAERTRIIAPLVPLTVGTRSTKEVENRRAFMCMDWSIRVFTPDWIDLCGNQYATHTAALRHLPEITDWNGVISATPILVDLKKQAAAAWNAAGNAARLAAWNAAGNAARAAAGNAARAAAREAARAAAGDAARLAAAAWDAARDAARAAAGTAATAKLNPIKEKLQASAADLVKRMCAVTEAVA